MNGSYYRITLDIKSIQSQITLPVKQYDTGRGIYISLSDGRKPYNIGKNCFAVFKGEKSDGTEVGNNCTIENNKIVYPITLQTVTSPGIVECEVSLYNADGGLITSPRFTLIVDPRAVGSDEYKSSSEYLVLESFLAEVRAAENERKEVFDSLDETFTAIGEELERLDDEVDLKASTFDRTAYGDLEANKENQEAFPSVPAMLQHVENYVNAMIGGIENGSY